MSNINNMVDKSCEVIDYLYSSAEPVGVSKISTALSMPKATVFRILVTLEKWDIVSKEYNTDKYRLGTSLIKYGSKASSNISLVKLAQPIIDEFAEEIGESVSLSMEHLDCSLVMYRALDSSSILASQLVSVSPLNCSASGKLFLCNRKLQDIQKYFKSEKCEKRNENSITSYSLYENEMKKFKNTGLMYDREEYEYGLSCVGAPIYHEDKIVAVISISGITTRLQAKGLASLEEKLLSKCMIISKQIGGLRLSDLT